MSGNATDDPDALLGGRYAAISQLGGRGRGDNGGVYLAHDLLTDQDVVLKFVMPGGDPKYAHRLEREAVALAANAGPRVVRLLDFGAILADGNEGEVGFFLVLERLPGLHLGAYRRCQPSRRLAVAEAIQIVCEILETVGEMHARRWAHRDLKPANVIRCVGRPSVLIDFELAAQRGPSGRRTRTLTPPGVIIGTPRYIAPETVSGSELGDHRVDLYAVGAILYELLTGIYAHDAPNEVGLLHACVHEDPKPFEALDDPPVVPGAVERATMQALAKDPDDRFQTADHMRAELLAALP